MLLLLIRHSSPIIIYVGWHLGKSVQLMPGHQLASTKHIQEEGRAVMKEGSF